MLTPQEIKGKEFEKVVFGGYSPDPVEDFRDKVIEDYTSLYKENAILKSKIKVLVEKVEEYRSTEDSMRMALFNAQKQGTEIVEAARQRRDEINEQVERELEERTRQIRDLIADEQARLEAARASTQRFLQSSKEVMRSHAEFLSRIDEIHHEPEPAPPPPTREQTIQDAAIEIGSAVERLTDDTPDIRERFDAPEPVRAEPQPQAKPKQEYAKPEPVKSEPVVAEQADSAPQYNDEGEPTKHYSAKSYNDEDSPTISRPRTDFNDLDKYFGSNAKKNETKKGE
ncbi:MAG: DivIVA domain-containing protein [Oscillospiraceae bacterium]|jgi:cell division initiation protein|nr:DivIVA domain-containing protein [Oscillospiraceae bacterium]